jgi:hypothetical protein
MIKKLLCSILVFSTIHISANAQSTNIQLGEDVYHLLDRYETLHGGFADRLFLNAQPTSRKDATQYLEHLYTSNDSNTLSSIDKTLIHRSLSLNREWLSDTSIAIKSRKAWFNTFYKTPSDFFLVNNKDFFLAINPVITAQYMREQVTIGSNKKSENLLSSTRGLELRGRIANKIGFYTYITDNQEQYPSYLNTWVLQNQAIPGADYYQNNPGSKTFDYMLARGYIDFAAIKNYVTISAGYDKNSIGDGLRSLFLSDFGANSTFVKINTKIWKLNYQNIYSEIIPFYQRGADRQLPTKYSTTHYLSVNPYKWLNFGLFENVVFSRSNHFSFGYMVPIIFFRAVERAYGSPDNVNIGLNLKVIPTKNVQLYGQLFLDEFKSSELFSSKGWWGNKYGVQLGAKYFNAFTIKNLDLQAEMNMVRPYTYSHSDSATNYSHYNQPLAHPLGSGFREFLAQAKYRPCADVQVTGKIMYYKKGVDTGGLNYGNNIFRSYNTVAMQHGVQMINGPESQCFMASINASYRLYERCFFDLGLQYRKMDYANDFLPNQQSMVIYTGVRINFARRAYDFF